MSQKKELLIFGLDGATFDLLDPWFDRGELSFLESIIDSGVSGKMRSTIPPNSGPAWTSFQTGVNPGKHGIFDWGSARVDTYRQGMVNASSVQAKTIWRLIGEAGKRVGVIGVPVTYPPQAVNGFMTTGVLTPKESEDYVYPPELRKGIEKEVGSYRVAPPHAEMALNKRRWIEELKRSIENKEKTALHLLSTQKWNVSMVYFMETDTVSHHLFPEGIESEKKDKNLNDKPREPVLEIYRRVEKAVKRIYDRTAEEDTHVMIVSDHGFGPLKWIFNVNSWLLENGYLQLKQSALIRIKKAISKLGLNQKNLYKVGNLLGPLARGNEWEMEGFNDILGKLFLSLKDVDWKNTKAYSRGGVTGALRLNVKGREPSGWIYPEDVPAIRDELTGALRDLRNPYTGELVVDRVLKNEEVYEGPSSFYGPDILFKTRGLRTDTGGMTVFKSLDPIIPGFAINGTHRMEGIFGAAGPKYARGLEVEGLKILDPAPIILHTLGLKIPSYMDGTPRKGVFSDEFWSNNQPEFWETKLPDLNQPGEDNKHEEEIKERLMELGYLA
ncbi:MAG: alkaline phosphatase family protein [Candidatus Bipolaricaulota bacterium]